MTSKNLNLNRLNPNQREAVLHGNGPLLILAGAGSGKTSTMTYRIAHLIAERHVSGLNILGLSFTNKAAGELKERVADLVKKVSGPLAMKGLTISTFHSLCVRILREHADVLGFQKNFSIVDQNDQKDILKQIFKNIRIDDRKFDLDHILFEIGQAKNRFLAPEKVEHFFLESGRLGQDYAIAAASSYGHYQAQLKVLNSMDFDDLLYYAVKLLEEHPQIREHYNARFRHILVDEYQDTNPSQFKLLRLLTERQQNICVVGDDDQSIYAWRGADPTHILEFHHHFQGAKVITLDQNYRSTATILDAANTVIANNKKRHPKKLWSDRGQGEPITEFILEDDRDEAEFVAEEIQERAKNQTRAWKDFAILYRSNTQSRVFEESLRRHRIPYKIVGSLSFLDRKEVKDVLCYWRLILNPKDDASLRRILNWPARGIGRTSVETLGNHAFANHLSLFEALAEAPKLTPKAAAGCLGLRALILDLRAQLETTPYSAEAIAQWGKTSLEKIQAKKAVEEENQDDPVQFARKWENVEELVHSLGQTQPDEAEEAAAGQPVNCVAVLREFIARMTLEKQDQEDKDDKKKDQEKDQVTLLTLHGAKGLEYPVVFMVGVEEGYLPHKRTIEGAEDFSEERRLAYVGITRAKDYLVLTRARNRVRYGKPVPRTRSRFMDEIPANMVVTTNKSSSPDLSSKEAVQEHEQKVKNHLESIRAMLAGKMAPPA